MRKIEAQLTVDASGEMRLHTGTRIEKGEYPVIVVMDEATKERRRPALKPFNLPVLDLGEWRGQEFRREDMYDDDGR